MIDHGGDRDRHRGLPQKLWEYISLTIEKPLCSSSVDQIDEGQVPNPQQTHAETEYPEQDTSPSVAEVEYVGEIVHDEGMGTADESVHNTTPHFVQLRVDTRRNEHPEPLSVYPSLSSDGISEMSLVVQDPLLEAQRSRIRIRWSGRIVVPTLLEEQRCEQAALDGALYHQDEHVFSELLIRGGVHLFTRDYRGRKTMCQAHLTVNYKTEEQVRRCRHYPAHVFLAGTQEDRYVVEWVEWFREKRDRN